MTEEVLAFDLKVVCADESEHEQVELKIIDDKVAFVTADGIKLEDDCAVRYINNGNFLAPVPSIEHAIIRYRRQS